tara:strand:+ start:929 stop:1564 length:636 start_codon:yes stop_codon:yes gene_type:complete
MNNLGKGMMIILSSPSGAGKTTLTRLLSEKNKNLEISISHTTRVPRENEIDGRDYFFTNKEEFKKLIKKNSFFEYATVFNNYYGTSKKTATDKLNQGIDILLDIDWQGTEQIKKLDLNFKLITFFILPPSTQVLKERLKNREVSNPDIVNERMSQFKSDIQHWNDYDYVVINENLDNCYKEINNKIIAEKKGIKLDKNLDRIKKKIDELIS